ncbi:MAG: hypothetical protein ACI857_002144 [Arenicella sp.]|jgi:hypothetical protein
MPAEVKTTRAIGIGLLIIGVVFLIINWISLSTGNVWFPKILLGGIVMSCLGLAMIIFPAHDANGYDKDYFSQVMGNTPVLNVIMWAVSIVLSIFAIMWVFDYYDLSMMTD